MTTPSILVQNLLTPSAVVIGKTDCPSNTEVKDLRTLQIANGCLACIPGVNILACGLTATLKARLVKKGDEGGQGLGRIPVLQAIDWLKRDRVILIACTVVGVAVLATLIGLLSAGIIPALGALIGVTILTGISTIMATAITIAELKKINLLLEKLRSIMATHRTGEAQRMGRLLQAGAAAAAAYTAAAF